MPVLGYVIVVVAAYLLGSFPTGFLVAKAKGIDIRAVGSGNIGASNAMRTVGKPAGIFVLLVDCAKGWLACFFGKWFCIWYVGTFTLFPTAGLDEQALESLIPIVPCEIIAGMVAVLGHNYSCWLGFKGGKGIATSAGVYLALAPAALGMALAAFVLAVAVTRYISVGSMVGAIVLPVAVWFTHDNWLLRIVTIVLGVMAILKHRKNIQRLMAGTENRIGKARQSTEAAK